MKSIIGVFFFVLGCFQLSMAQAVQEFSFSREIKGVEFENASIMKYVLEPDKSIIYLELSRVGAVQSKMGPIWSGGADPVEIKALGILELSKDLKLLSEELVFVKPDGIISKQYKLLKEPGNVTSSKNVMATQDDCLGILDIVDKYPALMQAEDSAERALPKEYYDNSIDYGGLGQKVKGFNSRLYRLKPEGTKKSLFAQLTNDQYDDIKSTYDWEPYRGGDKKNYWMKLSDSACDPLTGMVYAHNGLVRVGEDRGRSMEKIQEFVTYDKSGKEANRTEINFDVPHDIELRQMFYADKPEDGLLSIQGVVQVYRQQYGFGYKKLNPDPDPLYRKLYFWDAQGKELGNVDFKAPSEDTRMIRAFTAGNQLSLLAGKLKEGQWLTYHFADGQLSGPESAGAMAGDIAFKPAELASFSWEAVKEMAGADGGQTIIYHLKKEVKAADKTYTPSQGYLIFKLSPDGKIARVQHLKRSGKALPNSKTGIRVYPGEGYLTLLLSDPVTGDKGSMLDINAMRVDLNTLEKTPVLSMMAAGEGLSVERVSDSDNLLIFTTSPDGEKYLVTQLSL